MKNLEELIKEQRFVKIYRNKRRYHPIYGIPIGVGATLLTVVKLNDFDIDGFQVLRLDDISSIDKGRMQQVQEYILRQEGLYGSLPTHPYGNIDDLYSFFKRVKSNNLTISFKCERNDKNILFMGKVMKITKNLISIRKLNAFGEWDSQLTEFKLDDITLVHLFDRYTTIFSKYS